MVGHNPAIIVDAKTKKKLDEIKVHPRETYDDVVQRLLKKVSVRSDMKNVKLPRFKKQIEKKVGKNKQLC